MNLDRIYKGEQKWTVTVHPEYVNETNKSISISSINVWDALALVNSEFKANFIIRGRTITIGTAGIAVGNMFGYGKGKGLYSIQKNRGFITEDNYPPKSIWWYQKLAVQHIIQHMVVLLSKLPSRMYLMDMTLIHI